MKYDEMMKISNEFFDTIDFRKWLTPGRKTRVYDLMNCVEEWFNSHPDLLPEVFQGFVFNFVDEYEFGQYLEKRYGWQTEEVVVETHYMFPEFN